MFVTIEGWETRGLRCPDMKVSFLDSSGKVKRINLVQMPNGTGKSTVIELLSSVLTGNARYDAWGTEKVKSFQDPVTLPDSGSFHLTISVEQNNEKSQTSFEIYFDFLQGTAKYFTIRNVGVGIESQWLPPKTLKSFMNDKCVEVFAFHGDKVRRLIENGRSDAEAAIKAFFGLSKAEELLHKIEVHFEKESKNSRGNIRTDTGLENKKIQLVQWKERLKALEGQRDKLSNELDDMYKSRDSKKASVEDVIRQQETNHVELLEATELKGQASQEVVKFSLETFEYLKSPFLISDSLYSQLVNLKQHLDKLQLPGASVEFFNELSVADECVCGTPISDKMKNYILNNSSNYLSDDVSSNINALKSDIAIYSDTEEREKYAIHNLQSAKDSLLDIENDIAEINVRINNDATEAQRKLIEELDLLSSDITVKERQKEALTKESAVLNRRVLPQECKNIPTANAAIADLEKFISEAEGTLELFNNKEKLLDILRKSISETTTTISEELKVQSNQKLKQILVKGTPLEILNVGKHIQLGHNGQKQGSGSGGQNVSVAYSFATSVLERSGIQFPLIVDHPVTALQESARRGLAKNLTSICHQFIGFVIDTEKHGFADSSNINEEDLKTVTIFKTISGNHSYSEYVRKNSKNFDESLNGIVCYDRDFFDSFSDNKLEVED